MVKHYIATELLVNKEELGKLSEDEIVIEKVVILAAKMVVH